MNKLYASENKHANQTTILSIIKTPTRYVITSRFESNDISAHNNSSDGPALRATALIAYGNWLIANSNTTFALSTIWPIVKLDLDYVASNWNQTGFVACYITLYTKKLTIATASIYGRKSIPARSLRPPSSTVLFVREQLSLPNSARPLSSPVTQPKLPTLCASCR